MTIKEACNLTGLSPKSIRYYEKKGLLNVERKKHNDYRNYTEDDIEKLKLIKVLRYVDFSVDEIFQIFKNDSLSHSLEDKSKQLESQSNNCLEKQSICYSLLKDVKKNTFNQNINNYCSEINLLESEDLLDYQNSLLEALSPSIYDLFLETLILFAPILSLFIKIYAKIWDGLLLNTLFAFLSFELLFTSWKLYIIHIRKHKESSKESFKNNSLTIPVLLFVIILTIFSIKTLILFLDTVIAPTNYLFYDVSVIVVIFLIISFAFLVLYFFKNLINKKMNFLNGLFLEKYKYVYIILFFLIFYCFITSTVFVTDNEIIYRDPLHPLGIHYSYSDVTKIETGFGDKNFTFVPYNRKGEFYYRIYLDGKKVTFFTPSPNNKIKKYQNSPYLELEEFDAKLMKHNIRKFTNDTYSQNCNLDKEIVDRFIRIINNK